MFFILSKILAFVISPINWITLFVIMGIVIKHKRRKKICLSIAAALFFIFTNKLLISTAMNSLEIETMGKHELNKTYELGILLGGMVDIHSDTTKVTFNSNGDRLFQTIDLYVSGNIRKILITSGSGEVQLPSFKEASLIKRYLLNIGLPNEDIIAEIESRNTFENAIQSKAVIHALYGSNFNEEVLLISSASHLRRASKCFVKQGLNVVPYSTTKRAEKGPFIFKSEMILPDPEALWNWKVLNHELVGILVYRLQGYI